VTSPNLGSFTEENGVPSRVVFRRSPFSRGCVYGEITREEMAKERGGQGDERVVGWVVAHE
jgi:hypothetical protein